MDGCQIYKTLKWSKCLFQKNLRLISLFEKRQVFILANPKINVLWVCHYYLHRLRKIALFGMNWWFHWKCISCDVINELIIEHCAFTKISITFKIYEFSATRQCLARSLTFHCKITCTYNILLPFYQPGDECGRTNNSSQI